MIRSCLVTNRRGRHKAVRARQNQAEPSDASRGEHWEQPGDKLVGAFIRPGGIDDGGRPTSLGASARTFGGASWPSADSQIPAVIRVNAQQPISAGSSSRPRRRAIAGSTSAVIDAASPGVALPDPQLGFGVVDPYTAVTTVLPEESGGQPPTTPAARPLHLAPLPVPDTRPATAALIVTMIVALGVAAAFGVAGIARQGKRRRWQAPAAAFERNIQRQPRS